MLIRCCQCLLALIAFNFSLHAQTIITQWNFNSNPADANTATGTTSPSTGTGTLTLTGNITALFSSGASNGGSSDPAPAGDNSGYQTTTYPVASAANKTAGIQFAVPTTGYSNIVITYDLRHSNTASRYEQLQYTLDITATTPVWVDFQTADGSAGDTWFLRSFDLSSVPALNNNPKAGFRIVSVFGPSGTSYAASGSSSTYAGSGTWRFDMVTVKGTAVGADNTPPTAQSHNVTSSTSSYVVFSEPVSTNTATATGNYVFNPALAVSNAVVSAGRDTVFLTHVPLVNGQAYTLSVSGVQDAAMNTMTPASFNVLFNASLPNLVITEIIHSPNDIEMIEVYNAGGNAVNLGGLKWTDGTTGAFPTVSLAAGGTAVFATSPATASATLQVNPVYTLLNGLGASNDILVIRNSLNQVVDSVQYFVGTNGWPTAPTGVYGYSFELSSASGDNNNGANWFVPQNPVTPQPAQGIVRATPGVYPTPPYASPSANVTFTGTKVNVSETTATVTITAVLQNGGPQPSSAHIEVLPISTATSGIDFTLPAMATLNWPANASNASATLTITINNDAIAESAEYFILRMIDPINVNLPPAASNHFTVMIADDDQVAPAGSQSLQLTHIASFSNGAAGTNSAEIVAYDPASRRLFIANSVGAKLDIVNFSNPAAATLIASVPLSPYGNINSVAVKNGIVATAIENSTPELPGKVVFFDVNGNFIAQVEAGAMPDMILFNNAGTKVLTANEGQPNNAYTIDPEGSVTIVDISGGVAGVTQANVVTAGFSAFNSQAASLKAAGVRIFGLNNPTVAQDLEPEYITISADDNTAWVTCQENNAIAVIDLQAGVVTALRPLGTKDHSLARNALDASDQGSVIELAAWPVKGLYMPDAIASYSVNGQTYLVTANEGDSREYTAYMEAVRLGSASYVLDPTAFPYPEAVKSNIGRLNVSLASGDTDGDGDYDEIHAFGGRSFSIWNATTGALVWDSGNEMELIIAKHPVWSALFNASNANNTLKNRSDDKGPEPEGVALAQIGGRNYAFIALERIGGCMVYDITDPAQPFFVDYKNTRNANTYGGDNGAEGVLYINAANSPTGQPLVILANEVSSTLSFFGINTGVLDVTLAGIEAVNLGTLNRVNWRTVTEAAGDRFEIERSANGNAFVHLAFLPANGTASSYQYWDELPVSGVNYYRLKIHHVSGRISYSPVVTAVVRTMAAVQAYPNPVSGWLTLKTIRSADKGWVEVYDARGALLRRSGYTGDVIRIDMSAMPAGLYTVKVMNGKETTSLQVQKQ